MDAEVKQLENKYLNLIEPSNFFDGWAELDFIAWCNIGSIEDLEYLSAVLFESEMYVLATITNNLIYEKQGTKNNN